MTIREITNKGILNKNDIGVSTSTLSRGGSIQPELEKKEPNWTKF